MIQPHDPAHPEVLELIRQLDQYLQALYPPESNHLLSVEELQQPHVTFLGAHLQERLVGCGACVNQGGEYAEIKRMYVLPDCRGLGLGRRLLATLEQQARAEGLEWIRLETGIYQPEALKLYEKAGYQLCPPFGEYGEDPLSVFMEKGLGGGQAVGGQHSWIQ